MITMTRLTLKAARLNAGYSQKEAASLLGVSHCTMSKWERGVSMPKANQIDAICELYNVTYDMLIFLPSRLALS
jgi:transcriptional regulator with XRE-family HTH domain